MNAIDPTNLGKNIDVGVPVNPRYKRKNDTDATREDALSLQGALHLDQLDHFTLPTAFSPWKKFRLNNSDNNPLTKVALSQGLSSVNKVTSTDNQALNKTIFYRIYAVYLRIKGTRGLIGQVSLDMGYNNINWFSVVIAKGLKNDQYRSFSSKELKKLEKIFSTQLKERINLSDPSKEIFLDGEVSKKPLTSRGLSSVNKVTSPDNQAFNKTIFERIHMVYLSLKQRGLSTLDVSFDMGYRSLSWFSTIILNGSKHGRYRSFSLEKLEKLEKIFSAQLKERINLSDLSKEIFLDRGVTNVTLPSSADVNCSIIQKLQEQKNDKQVLPLPSALSCNNCETSLRNPSMPIIPEARRGYAVFKNNDLCSLSNKGETLQPIGKSDLSFILNNDQKASNN